MRAIAIDFETANEQRSSPCSVGLAWIEDGAVIRVEERLIRPKDMRFSRFNIAVHGIRPADVEDAAEFPEVMEEFEDDLGDTLVIAHNASFDMSVMRASYQLYGIACPDIDYICTLKMAKMVWQELASHRLNEVSRHIDFSFKHHNAAEDAHACGEVALAAARKLNVNALRDLPIKLDMTMGRLHPGGYSPCSVKRPAKTENR
ncbi:3'-5' exonuclease [Aminobacter anthyllidis]|uniref:3'-5' exonuclease n=1 Tax=Aminobacter anthyllidis TaxID=1035067 RepID=A0A9X1D400_9HYPH|nr:3'-5' exonuclease [Aminobacter anthyllidis]MBT1156225.1 3'-5' exonuclease [Aminobacter anthyllidis]